MSPRVKAEGDTWSVRLGERARPGTRTLLFFCTTTSQRPYRVVEVPQERVGDLDDLEKLDETALQELFRASCSMGYPQTYD